MLENLYSWFPARSDTNKAVQPQRMAGETRNFVFRKKRDRTIFVAETKAMISCTIIAQLICVFVFAYKKSRFSHEAAHSYGQVLFPVLELRFPFINLIYCIPLVKC